MADKFELKITLIVKRTELHFILFYFTHIQMSSFKKYLKGMQRLSIILKYGPSVSAKASRVNGLNYTGVTNRTGK
jgi:hypothetical protein